MRCRPFTALATSLAIAIGAAACGADKVTPPDDGGHETPAIVTIAVTPSSTSMEVGGATHLSAEAKDANGNAVPSTTFTWSSSSPDIATVDVGGSVTAKAVGATNITAASGAVHSSPVAVTVTVALDRSPWPTIGASSGERITAAQDAGTLTAEEALVYRVYAAFTDPRLPVEYRGVVEASVDNSILMEAGAKFATLSAVARATIAPFFLPPGTPGSWYNARYPLTPAVTPAAIRTTTGSSRPAAAQGAPPVADCQLLAAVFASTETEHFNFRHVAGDVYSSEVTALIVPEAEKIYTAETSTFNKYPTLATGAPPPSRCDNKIDVWVLPDLRLVGGVAPSDPRHDAAAWVSQYTPSCEPGPSYITIWGRPFADARTMRNLFAHEFFHVLELGSYAHTTSCLLQYFWLGEATGQWAMDLVYPADNYEHSSARSYAYDDHTISIDADVRDRSTNGYTDYPFLLYLARKYGNGAVKEIWDATATANSVTAIANGIQSHGGLKNVWPEYALEFWNDYDAGVHDFLHAKDGLEWGMKLVYDMSDEPGQPYFVLPKPSTKAVLEGAPRNSFELLFWAPPGISTGLAREIPRTSIQADYVKFTDPAASSVLFLNPIAVAPPPNLKIQALVKRGGTWRDVEDWTNKPYKSFCRDIPSEHIEELVLIYSNSESERDAPAIPVYSVPRINISNVACAKWTGTSTITVTGGGATSTTTATFTLERQPRPPEAPEGGTGSETFTVTSGSVTGSSTAPCATQNAQGPIAALDGTLLINVDNLDFGSLGPPPDRFVVMGTGATTLPTTSVVCPDDFTTVVDQVWDWLYIPAPGLYSVSADGRTIEGTVTETSSLVTKISTWKLTAVKE